MARRRKGRDIDGVLLLDKPAGYSSNQALQKVRRLLQARKAGHSGSLDPFATGMLPICLGEATKTAAFMLNARKTYRAVAQLGQSTTTGDLEGEIAGEQPVPDLARDSIEAVMRKFVGAIAQVPPMYSALKHQGQPLYRLARKGITVEREARRVMIYRLELTGWDPPCLTFEVHCSKGTYVRTLAEDLCAGLGSCGHLVALRRLCVEPFREKDMITMEALGKTVAEDQYHEVLLPLDAGLSAWPRIDLDDGSAKRFSHGNPVPVDGVPARVRVFDQGGDILGLAEVQADGMLRAMRVFVNTQSS